MATYGDLKKSILVALDLNDSVSSGSLHDEIQRLLIAELTEIVATLRPRELLAKSAVTEVTSASTGISIVCDFLVTDFVEAFKIAVDRDDGDNQTAPTLDYIPFESWLDLNKFRGGNDRPRDIFTIDEQGYAIFKTWPTGSEVWDTTLWYYKKPAAYNNSNSPELPYYHHNYLTTAVIRHFPHRFKGTREILFQHYVNLHQERYKNLMRNRRAHTLMNLRVRKSSVAPGRDSMWPGSIITS